MRAPNSPEEIEAAVASGRVVVVKFSASWCGPCKALAPYVYQMANEFESKGVIFFEIDVKGDWTEYALENNARTVPYVQIYSKGNLIGYVSGNQPDGIRNGIIAGLSM